MSVSRRTDRAASSGTGHKSGSAMQKLVPFESELILMRVLSVVAEVQKIGICQWEIHKIQSRDTIITPIA
jgi:hypothetical protein